MNQAAAQMMVFDGNIGHEHQYKPPPTPSCRQITVLDKLPCGNIEQGYQHGLRWLHRLFTSVWTPAVASQHVLGISTWFQAMAQT